MVRIIGFWLSIVLGGILLGAASPASSPTDLYNWDAIGALAIIATGFVGGTWFIVSMAIHSAIVQSERAQTETMMRLVAELRHEMSDPESGFMPVRLAESTHQNLYDAISRLMERT